MLWIVVLFACCCIGCSRKGDGGDAQAENADKLPATIMKVSQSAKLYTTEIQVHKIVLFNDERHVKGNFFSSQFDIKLPIGSRKVLIPVDATLKAYIDFSSFSAENVRQETSNGQKKLIITLPDPQIELTASKIDHANTKEFVSALRSDFSNEELTKYTKQGIDEIVKEVPKMGLIETSRQQAANVLIPLFAQAGYKEEDITIVFRNDLKEKTAPELIKVIE